MPISLRRTTGGTSLVQSIAEILDIPGGSIGDIVTITPPAGQRVSIGYLSAFNTTENGITITFGSRVLISGGTLMANGNLSGGFRVGVGERSSSPLLELVGDYGEDFIITKSGSTAGSILLGYCFVE